MNLFENKRVGAWMGIAFVVLFVGGFLAFPTPSDNKDTAKWEGWWAVNRATFRVPRVKPYATWVPPYPVLPDEHVARIRRLFAERGDDRYVKYE